MPIINIDELYYITTINKDQKPIAEPFKRPVKFKNYVTGNKKCWYIGIGSIHSVYYVHNHIPNHVLKNIQTGSVFLLLSMERESFVNVVQLIYEEIVIKLNISPKQIILVVGSEGFYEEVIKVANQLDKDQIKVVSFLSTENDMHRSQLLIKSRFLNRNIKKKFLNLNRRWRPHRPMLVGLLKSMNLLQHGYVSLAPSDDNVNWSNIWDPIISMHNYYKCDESLNLLLSNKEDIMNIPPLYLDEDDLTINHFEIKQKTIQYYEESYFSIVSETNFFDGPRFLTEKIFKPVVHKHPFILLSVHKSLESFRRLGYKTFSPFFNEDYDLEENPCKRMMMIIAEIERLCNLSDEEWNNMLVELDKICHYNFLVLESKKHIKDYITFYN